MGLVDFLTTSDQKQSFSETINVSHFYSYYISISGLWDNMAIYVKQASNLMLLYSMEHSYLDL